MADDRSQKTEKRLIHNMVITRSPEETEQFGRDVAKLLGADDVVAFFGELGSGKTTMIRGICDAFGVVKGVKSPSFVYLRIYDAPVVIYHFDFFRLRMMDELVNVGFDEYFYAGGLVLLEWADRIAGLLPTDHYEVKMRIISETEREIAVTHRRSQ